MMRPLVAMLLLAALLAGTLAPWASAQAPPLPFPTPATGTTDVKMSVDITDPGGSMLPSRPYTYKLTVRYQYGALGVVPPDQQSCAELSVTGLPSFATGNVTPPKVCFDVQPAFVAAGTTVENKTAVLELNLTNDAPALQPFNVTVKADAAANGPLKEAHAQAEHIFLPGFLGKLGYTPPASVIIRGGGSQPLLLTVRNLGNGPVEVRFTNLTAPQYVRADLPPPLLLKNPGDVGTAVLMLHAPWTVPVKGDLMLQMETHHPERKDLAGDSVRARFPLEGKAAVPGFEPLLALGLLGVAAVMRKRAA